MGFISAIIALLRAVPSLERLFLKVADGVREAKAKARFNASWAALMLLLLLTACQTGRELNGVKTLTDHPQFPKAAQHAPEWTRAALRKVAELEYEIERN